MLRSTLYRSSGLWRRGGSAVASRSYGLAEGFVYHPEDPPTKLPDWAGADREALVYKSLEDFVPTSVVTLNGALFNAPVRRDLVAETVLWQRARWRAGTAHTKSRGEVDRTKKKPWPQKGLGRARHGSKSSPIWVGGGVAMGPKPKIWAFPQNRGVRRFALRSAMTMKYANGCLWIIETPELENHKTKNFVAAMHRLRWESALILDDAPLGHWGSTWNLSLASANMKNFQVMNYLGANVYSVLLYHNLVITQRALVQLEKRFEDYAAKKLMY
mmetsp:Transcript_1606/g.4821  ORF Transcript_1606/g.4821 Transcript_1606/m.4821 type:complete len:272 (-) Transcript_1606:1185-2000(-)